MMRRCVQSTITASAVAHPRRFGSTDYAWRNEEIERENKLRDEASKGMSQIYAIKNPNAYLHCLPGGKGMFSSSTATTAAASSSSSASSSPFAAMGSMFGGGGNNNDNKNENNDNNKGSSSDSGEYKATMTDHFLLATGFVISVYSFKVMYTRQFGDKSEEMDSPVPIWVSGSPEIKGKYFLFSSITDVEERHRIFSEFSQARTAVIQQVTAHNRQVTRALHERSLKSSSSSSATADGAAAPAALSAEEEASLQYVGIPPHFNDFFSWLDAAYPTWCVGRRFTNIPQIHSILASGAQGMDTVGGAALHRAVSELSAETAAANRSQAVAEGKAAPAQQWGGLTSIGSLTNTGTIRERAERVDAFLDASQQVTSGNGGIMSLFGLGGGGGSNTAPNSVPPFQQQQYGGGYYGMPPPQQQQQSQYQQQPPGDQQQWMQQQPAYGGMNGGNVYGGQGQQYGAPPHQQQQQQGYMGAPASFGAPSPQQQQQEYPPYAPPSAGALMNARAHMQQFHTTNADQSNNNSAYYGSGTGFYGNASGGPPSRPSTFTGSESVSLQDVVGGEVVPQKASK